jgi:integrase/recombinase XerD
VSNIVQVQVLSRAPLNTEHLKDSGENALSRNLSRQAWLALANAAKALENIARVMSGENVSHPVTALSLPHQGGHSDSTVADTINDFLIAKARVGRSNRYLGTLRYSLMKFSRGRSRQPISAVTTEEIEIWLAESGLSPRTQKGCLLDVRTLYNFAVRRGYCSDNPATAAEAAPPGASQIGIHTPAQISVVLETARRMDLNTCRALAVRYFAGLRASEAALLDEKEIKREQGLIEVTADKSKTRRRRLVTILPVLNAWLDVGGSLPLHDVSNRMRALTKAVKAEGVPWPANAPRHSFCSYHLAAFENAAKTALEAGHSEQMLFQHYRALVSKAEAEKFWGIRPRQI